MNIDSGLDFSSLMVKQPQGADFTLLIDNKGALKGFFPVGGDVGCHIAGGAMRAYLHHQKLARKRER